MKLSLKTIMPITAAGILALASCSRVENRTKEYMKKHDYTQKSYDALKSDIRELNGRSIILQSRLDSMAYRDIFNTTQAAKDSAKIAEFERIAAAMRPNEIYPPSNALYSIDEKLSENGISIKKMDEIEAQDDWFSSDVTRANTKLHLADDWAYREFFKKIGILNDSISKQCDDVSKEIRP